MSMGVCILVYVALTLSEHSQFNSFISSKSAALTDEESKKHYYADGSFFLYFLFYSSGIYNPKQVIWHDSLIKINDFIPQRIIQVIL